MEGVWAKNKLDTIWEVYHGYSLTSQYCYLIFNLITLGEELSLNIIRMKQLIRTEQFHECKKGWEFLRGGGRFLQH